MKHTLGPWEHNDYQIIAGETVIANCTYGARNSNNANDARLIAAAPDLLDALKLMVEQFTKGSGHSTLKDSEARIKAHAAIAKATGENQ